MTGIAVLAEEIASGDGLASLPLSAEGFTAPISQSGYNGLTLAGNGVAAKDGFVVAAIAYDPGWKVSIDGTPVEGRRAKVKFLAVTVPVGKHDIGLRFDPLSRLFHPFARYDTILLLIILAVVALKPLSRIRRRR